MMKILLLLMMFVQAPLVAQNAADKADELLDRAVARIKADAPVLMDYTYSVYDDDDAPVQFDGGIIYVDGERYALLMDEMKVWCDGSTQWSYMLDIDEIYITEASSEEAQNLSPLYIMEHYREGYNISSVDRGDALLVTLEAVDDEAEISIVELLLEKKQERLVSMNVIMNGQGRLEVLLDGYTAHCGVDDSIYMCDEAEFPTAEIIDMR